MNCVSSFNPIHHSYTLFTLSSPPIHTNTLNFLHTLSEEWYRVNGWKIEERLFRTVWMICIEVVCWLIWCEEEWRSNGKLLRLMKGMKNVRQYDLDEWMISMGEKWYELDTWVQTNTPKQFWTVENRRDDSWQEYQISNP